MVVRFASQAGAFSPAEEPQVSVAADGTLAAIHEPSRVTIVEVPSGLAFAEISVDPDALASEVAWVGPPPRMLVSSRYAAHSTVHLLDPYGPRTIAEIRLESPMRLVTTVGATGLVIGPASAAVLAAGEAQLTWSPFPSRTVPVVAGAAAGQFVVAFTGSIEEWDPQSRLPKRRMKLPRAAAITAVGGNGRVVWVTTQQEPARIDVIPLINRGQPRAHDLPEPIAHITGHPRSDLVVCAGARTGRLYIVDLDGRRHMRAIGLAGLDRIEAIALIVGRMVGVLAAQAQHPIVIVPLDGRDVDAEAEAGLVLPRSDPEISSAPPDAAEAPDVPDAAGPEARQPEAPPAPESSLSAEHLGPSTPQVSLSLSTLAPPQTPPAAARPAAAATSRVRPSTSHPALARSAAPADTRPAQSASERFSAWRDVVRQNQPGPDLIAPAANPADLPRSDARQSWRDEVVVWSRLIASGAMDYNAPTAPAIDTLLARFDLALQLRPVLVLLYGAHLCGELGVAPVDVARMLDRQWDEALGRGELARRGVASYNRSRVALSRMILRVLDELPPATGTLVGEPGPVALLGPCVVVAGDEPLTAIAAQCLSRVGGAILAAHGEPDRAELFREARAFGAVPMLRITVSLDTALSEPAIFVAGDAELADRLGLPRLA